MRKQSTMSAIQMENAEALFHPASSWTAEIAMGVLMEFAFGRVAMRTADNVENVTLHPADASQPKESLVTTVNPLLCTTLAAQTARVRDTNATWNAPTEVAIKWIKI